MAYTLKGKKCGTVRFKPLKNGIVDKESESYSSTVTSNPIEKGSEINDHVNNASPMFNLSGVLVDGNKSKKALINMRAKRDIIKYTGKTQMKNLVITNLKFDGTSKNKKGYAFTMSLKQVQITAPKKKGKKKKKMSEQDSGKSKKKKLKATKNKGHTAKASASVSSSSKKKLNKAKKSKSSKAPLTRKTKGYSGA